MVFRNAPALGVINGTMGTVTGIDRDRGDLVVETMEAEPRTVRLPAWFWNAKGRRRVALSYCRTIHKAQGSTYRGVSLTLAGDETIHLEAMHVALSRGTEANLLYYTGEPPPDEDHHVALVEEAEFEGLVAAAGRSRAQIMAIDQMEDQASVPGEVGGVGAWMEKPMTAKQAAVLAKHDALPEHGLSWVEASLLIDHATDAQPGEQAKAWLRENGAGAEEAALVVEHAKRRLQSLRSSEADEAARERQRLRRRTWAQHSRTGANNAANGPAAAVPRVRTGR
jgi:hypothetical protein